MLLVKRQTHFNRKGYIVSETLSTISKLLSLEPNNTRVFVFDIDSTLYDVIPRNQEIVRNFGRTANLPPELKSALEGFQSKPEDWGIKEGLKRIHENLPIDETVIKLIQKHWSKNFFTKDFLHFDKEYPGSVELLKQLDRISPVYYLTGRDIARMGEGTIEQLKKSKFPMDEKRNKLILKPDKSLLDHEYKLDELIKLKTNFSEIHFFENEPVILNAVFDKDSAIQLYYIDSVNSGRAEIYPEIKSIEPNFFIS